jgi:transcriptional regulator with XRE-family HTH domain
MPKAKIKTARSARRPAADRHALSSQLRDIIASRGLSAYALGQQAGVDPGVISRFLAGVRDIRLETADRITAALGLRLVEVGQRRGRSGTSIRPRPEVAPELGPTAIRPTAEG